MGIFSKWTAAPSTPKLKSVSLPDDEDTTSRHPSDKIAARALHKRVVAESRPSTPLSLVRTRRDSTAKAKPSKPVSTSYEPKHASHPRLNVSESSKPIAVKLPEGRSLVREHRASLAAGSSNMAGGGLPESQSRLRSVHKGRPTSHQPPATQTVVFPSKADNDFCGGSIQVKPAMGSVPSKSYPPAKSLDQSGSKPTLNDGKCSGLTLANEYSRRRHHSTAGGSYSPPSHISSRRAETPGPASWTTVKKGLHFNFDERSYLITKIVPTKGEAVALTWPLVEYNYKRHRPLLYFDIAFDPDISANVRAKKYGEGVFMNLTTAEREMPVCTHDTVTDMHIVYPKLPSWPIRVHRDEGIRCIDVFVAIFKTFNRRLPKEEAYQMIPAEHMHAYVPAFEQRCRDTPCLTEYEKRQGMRRVDLLRGTRMFSGLTQVRDGSWTLELVHPTGP